jgi:hypothetical protein
MVDAEAGDRPPTPERPAAGGEAVLAGASHVFAAAIENRAKEVGLAVLDVQRMTLEISQFIEPG